MHRTLIKYSMLNLRLFIEHFTMLSILPLTSFAFYIVLFIFVLNVFYASQSTK